MSFIIYDIIILILFAIFISSFLYTRRKNIKKEGLLLLYRANWGIKLIKKVGKKYKKTIRFLGFISITLGYVLMGIMVFLFGKVVWSYLFQPEIVQMIKVPPIMPLIPYLPSVFKLTFLPPFYFIYWIIIIAIIAIPHEFAHGVYAAYNNIKIRKTGFGFFPYFLPIFLAAFVEMDEKGLSKKSKFAQMSTLSAGTFANVLTGIFFVFVLAGFFSIAYSPSGVTFDTYSYSILNASSIQTINDVPLNNGYENILELLESGKNEIKTSSNSSYFIEKDFFEKPQNKLAFEEKGILVAYHNSPAAKNDLEGAINRVNNKDIESKKDLFEELSSKSPGEKISIETILQNKSTKSYDLTLGEHPEQKGMAWLGVGFIDTSGEGFLPRIGSFVTSFKESHVYYTSKYVYSDFIYNLLWWLVLISFSVAIINMLPVGMFDGGRFFMLTIASITGSEKIAKKAFKFVTLLFLFLLLVILFSWFTGMFL